MTAVAFVLLASVLPMAAHAGCTVESVEMPVKVGGSRAIATVRINGTSVPMTVDSGATFSMLTDAAAAQLGLRTRRNPSLRVQGITGSVEAQTTVVDKLELLKGEIDRVEFIVGGNEPGAGTMGLIGRNILSIADTEYDLAHGVIRFLFPSDDCAKANMAYWAGTSPVTEIELEPDYRSKLPAIRTRARLNGSTLVALFDTGATTIVSARAARRAGVAETDWKPDGPMYGAGRGRADTWTAPFDRVELGNEAIRNNRLHVGDFALEEADMLVGIDFFLSHRLYVSQKQSKMFLTYNGGPIFALDTIESASPMAVDATRGGVPVMTADRYARRGAASAARHDYDSALADLDRACELEPGSAALFAQRGALHEAFFHPTKALEDYGRALELDASQVDARLRRATLRSVLEDRDGASADLGALDKAIAPQSQMRLEMARVHMELRQPAQALAQLNQWLPAHPHEVTRDEALDTRCRARTSLGIELDKALDDCDDAVDSDARNAAYLDSRGWVYLRLGKYSRALKDFDRSVEYKPASASSLYGRGVAKTLLGQAEQGGADLAAARKLLPDVERDVPLGGLLKDRTSQP